MTTGQHQAYHQHYQIFVRCDKSRMRYRVKMRNFAFFLLPVLAFEASTYAGTHSKPSNTKHVAFSPRAYSADVPASRTAPTLQEIYGSLPKNSTSPLPHSKKKRREAILRLNYFSDLKKINPRENATEFKWCGSDARQPNQIPADNAALVPHPQPIDKKYGSYVDFISLPFDRYFALDDTVNNEYLEGCLTYKNEVNCSKTQRVLFRQLFGCTTVNVDRHPFPSFLVSKPWNDPRLANCFFSINDDFNVFYFALTNQGVWAIYTHNAQFDGDLPFQAKRLVGTRQKYDEPVDVAIEYDGVTNSITYYVNGYPVWIINSLGLPPSDDGYTKIDLGVGTPHSQPQQAMSHFTLRTGTEKCLDETDPNDADSNVRLVAFLPLTDPYYGGKNTTLYDPFNTKGNVIFGQGAIATLHHVLVLRQDSLPMWSASRKTQRNPSSKKRSKNFDNMEMFSNYFNRINSKN